MKNFFLTLMCFVLFGNVLFSQNEKKEKGFEGNFYAGGSISAGIASGFFGIGVNPEFGYSLTKWADIGLVANYNYTSRRYLDSIGQYSSTDKRRQTLYGGGLYTRLFPVKFLFVQAQIEHNWITEKYFFSGGSVKDKVSVNSLLIGAGYTTGRDPLGKSAYGYLAVLVDVFKHGNSPYVTYSDNNQRLLLPIIRAGYIVPLFQGK